MLKFFNVKSLKSQEITLRKYLKKTQVENLYKHGS